jgi:hypothetical protein
MDAINQMQDKVKIVKRSFGLMIVIGIVLTVLAIFSAKLINRFYPLPELVVTIFEYSGYICWSATLGMRGWDIQTWCGKTPAEVLNQKLARIFSLVGIFLFVMSRELIAKS